MKYRFAGAAIVVLFSITAQAHDAPTKELGCMVFNSKGRHLKPAEMSDREMMQVSNCLNSPSQAQIDAVVEELRTQSETAPYTPKM